MSSPFPQSAPRFSRFELASGAGGRWLGEPPDEVTGVCTDTRALAQGSLFVALEGEKFDGHAFLEEARSRGAVAAVVTERWAAAHAVGARALGGGAPALPLLAVRDTLTALGALARLHRRRFDIPVVGVTGSNGKTTTREMIGAILRARGPALKTEGNLNNEVGVPLTLFGLTAGHERAVVELGMNHPGEIARLTAIAEPRVGVVTFAGPAHLETLGTVDAVADAKAELYFGLPGDGICVANADDPRMLRRAQASGRSMITFSTRRGVGGDVVVLDLLHHGADGLRFTLGIGHREVEVALPLVGLHNMANAAAAAAAATALGCSDREIAGGLATVRPVGRRLRVDELPGGVTLVDDCYNANPASVKAALATLADLAAGGRRAVAVLGDMLELGEAEVASHAEVGAAAAGVAKRLAAFGPRSRATADAARQGGLPDEAVLHTESLPTLVAAVKDWLLPGDVLLVKGSRGMQLERLVEALRPGPG